VCWRGGFGRIVAYPDITPNFEFCPVRRSYNHNSEDREGEWMSLSQQRSKGILSVSMSKMTDVLEQSRGDPQFRGTEKHVADATR